MRILGFLFFLTLFAFAKPPEWLKKKPVDPNSYIGIAKVSKDVGDYRQRALNMALSFISSEISVMVKSTTNSLIKDINGLIDDRFESSSTTVSKQELEGYELVDTWESKKEYAVYCKLSKQKYLESKRKNFEGPLEMLRNSYQMFEEVVKERNFGKALDFANTIDKDSKTLLQNSRHLLPFMTTFEMNDLAVYTNILKSLIADLSVVVKDDGVYPFSWCGPEQIKIILADQEKKPWNNWEGVLYDSQGNELYAFNKQSDSIVDFPKTIYTSSLLELRYSLAIKHRGKVDMVHKMDFSIPINVLAEKGIVSLKGIPEALRGDIENLIEKRFVELKQSKKGADMDINIIDINVEYFRSFSSPKWEKGTLVFTFKNISASKIRNVGVGKFEVSCSGNSLEEAITKGLKTLEERMFF